MEVVSKYTSYTEQNSYDRSLPKLCFDVSLTNQTKKNVKSVEGLAYFYNNLNELLYTCDTTFFYRWMPKDEATYDNEDRMQIYPVR